MGRPPCCDKTNVKRGLWTPEEDAKILAYVANHGIGNWTAVPKKAGYFLDFFIHEHGFKLRLQYNATNVVVNVIPLRRSQILYIEAAFAVADCNLKLCS